MMQSPSAPNLQNRQHNTQRAIAWVDDHAQEIVRLARALIAAPTQNPPGNERAAAEVAQAWLNALGFTECTTFEHLPGRANLLCHWRSGSAGKTLLLNGHLDTKPAGDLALWHTNPWEGVVKDGRLYGLGAVDMKGPDAALIYGMAAAVAVGADTLQGNVMLALTADEEGQALEGARFLVQEQGVRADAALIAEPSGILAPWDSIPVISRGFCAVRFRVQGTQTHSSIGDRVPIVNATIAASRLLLYLHEHLALRWTPTDLCPTGPTVNLGATFHAGSAIAIVSGHAEFSADIRTLPGMHQHEVAEDINTALAGFRALHPEIECAWAFVEGPLAWTTPTAVPADLDLVQSVQYAARQVLGATPPLGYFPGGTDAIWWQGWGGIPTIPGFGPGLLSSAHRPNEYVDIDGLIQAAKMYALTILDYLAPA